MTGLRTDLNLSALEDLLALVPNSVSKVKLEEATQEDYLKVWKFFEENSNPEIVRSLPVPTSELSQFKKHESYLFLLMQRQKTSRFFPPELFKDISSASNLTPRGIKTPFTSSKSAEISFSIFIANGKIAGPLLKAIAQTRAFELESHLNKYPSVLSSIFAGIQVKSKKVTKTETCFSQYGTVKLFHEEFLIWNHFEPQAFLSFFQCKEPGKLFMNPYGVTLHRPKMSSLSLKGIQNKIQEKEFAEVADIQELENLDIRNTVRNELKLEFYNEKISKMTEGVYVSGDLVARNKVLLSEAGVTHIINCAGNVCLNYYPEVFTYLTFNIKDSNNCNIESLFYQIIEFIETSLQSNGKVLVHCMQGVSRSVSLCIAYLIFKLRLPYEEVLSKCKEIREISSPNVGFQVQLIWFFKRLTLPFDSLPHNPRVFMTCSFDNDQRSLVVCKLVMSSATCTVLDPRSYFLILSESRSFIWKGKNVGNNSQYYEEASSKHSLFLIQHEKAQPFVEVLQDEEPQEFWNLWTTQVQVEVNSEWDSELVQVLQVDEEDSLKAESFRDSEENFQQRLSSSFVKQEVMIESKEPNVEVLSVRSESVEADPE